MTASVFFDTNVLVYAAVGTGRDERKRKRALEPIESAEFSVTVVKKASRPLQAAQALEWIEQFTAFPCQAGRPSPGPDRGGALRAIRNLLLYSEDLKDGRQYGQVRVVNRFA